MLFSRLRRITRDGNWIAEIDGLRFLSIGFVFLFHLFTALSAVTLVTPTAVANLLLLPIRHGARGVPVFFTISGLVLALPFARSYLAGAPSVSLRKYYLRRLTRLEPPYILCVLGSTLLYAAYHHGFSGVLPHLLASLFYLHNIVFGNTSQVNGVLWSLEIEIQFYLAAPLLMQIFRLRNAVARRAILIIFALAWMAAQPHLLHTPRTQMTLLGSLPSFLAGMLAADIFIAQPQPARIWTKNLWDILGVAALAAIYLGPVSEMQVNPLLPASAFVLCVAALRGNLLRRTLASRWIAVIGGMCYSIYLWHLNLIRAVLLVTRHCLLPHAGFAANYLLQFLLTGVPVLLLCAVAYLAVERPCMNPNWPSQLLLKLGRRRSEATALDSGGVH